MKLDWGCVGEVRVCSTQRRGQHEGPPRERRCRVQARLRLEQSKTKLGSARHIGEATDSHAGEASSSMMERSSVAIKTKAESLVGRAHAGSGRGDQGEECMELKCSRGSGFGRAQRCHRQGQLEVAFERPRRRQGLPRMRVHGRGRAVSGQGAHGHGNSRRRRRAWRGCSSSRRQPKEWPLQQESDAQGLLINYEGFKAQPVPLF